MGACYVSDPSVFEGWLPLREAAKELNVAYATAAKHMRTVKFGNQLVVSRAEVERFQANPPVQGRSPDKKLREIAAYLDLPLEEVRAHRERARAKRSAERRGKRDGQSAKQKR
jgi:hypothetical protein